MMNMFVFMLLIITAVAAIALMQATSSAQYGQGGKLERPEMKLFRESGAVYPHFELLARRFKRKRLLYFIRTVGYSPVGRLPYKQPLHDKSCIARATMSWSGKSCIAGAFLSRWVKSCIARAAAIYGNVYGLTASDMAFCSVSEKSEIARRKRSRTERITGKALAIGEKITETLETLLFADYIPYALIKNRKSKIKNCFCACCSLPVRIIRLPKQGIWSLRTPGGKN